MNVKFCKALADFQQEVKPVHEASKNDFAKYSYAGLPAIFKAINPLLKKHGLGFTQIVQGTSLTTIVFHVESGETIEGTIEIPQGVQLKGMNDFQVMGSAISYLRRYSISAILGLVTDSDMDTSGQQVAPAKKSKPAITDDRFKKALEAILAGDYSRDELEAKYALTTDQIKKLNS